MKILCNSGSSKQQKNDASAGIISRAISPLSKTLLAAPCSIASAERIFAGYTNVLEGRERVLIMLKNYYKFSTLFISLTTISTS